MEKDLKKLLLVTLTLVVVLLTTFFVLKTRKPQGVREDSAAGTDVVKMDVIVEGEGTVPPGFPHIPVYPKTNLISSDIQSTSGTAVWETTDPLPVVVAWYMGQFSDQGWYMTTASDDPSSQTAQRFVEMKGNNSAEVYVSAEQSKTRIFVKASL